MNQPCGHCLTGHLLTKPHNFSFPDLDADDDVVDNYNDDWQDIDLGSDFVKEAPDSNRGNTDQRARSIYQIVSQGLCQLWPWPHFHGHIQH